jgi:hypothetical protein
MKKIKSLKALSLQIAKQNEAFNLMTKEEKIVTIAKDCLNRLDLNQITAKTGVLFGWNEREHKGKESVQTVCNTDSKFNCSACMKGGLLLSYIGRVNQFNFGQISKRNNIRSREHKKLTELFSKEQLALIEFAFEGRLYINIKFTKETILKVVKFYYENGGRYAYYEKDEFDDMVKEQQAKDFVTLRCYSKDEEKRMIAICENIIENKGVFIP